MLDIIGVPFDSCGAKVGSSLGPDALRLAGLREGLGALGHKVRDMGNLARPKLMESTSGIRNFRLGLENSKAVKQRVLRSLDAHRIPLVLGGDHSISLGSLAAAVEYFGEDLAVMWIDAHGDINTPLTTPSRNLHGMTLAVALGWEAGTSGSSAVQWSRLQKTLFPRRYLAEDQVAWIGLRNLDLGEKEALRRQRAWFVRTMQDIDIDGIARACDAFDRWLTESKRPALWISFDVDVLDPALAPGTGSAVRGGLTYREAHLLSEMTYTKLSANKCPYRLVGVDIVEVNPLLDMYNQTAHVTVEWICSLFGKTILGT
jgi:arginase